MNQRTATLAAALAAAGFLLSALMGCSSGSSGSTGGLISTNAPAAGPSTSRSLVLPGSLCLTSMQGDWEYGRNDPPAVHQPGIPDLALESVVEFRRYDRLGITSSGRPTGSTRYYGREVDRRLTYRAYPYSSR